MSVGCDGESLPDCERLKPFDLRPGTQAAPMTPGSIRQRSPGTL